MRRKILKWVFRFLFLALLVGIGILGTIVSSNIFETDNPPYFDWAHEVYVGSPYVVETLTLDSSRLVRALTSKAKRAYTKFDLFDEELTEKVDSFLARYQANEKEDVNALQDLKGEVENLLATLYAHIRSFNGRPLTQNDKEHYLALYRLRSIDREIVQMLLNRNVEALTFFQKPRNIPTGTGRWELLVQKPGSAHLYRYYEMVNSTDMLLEIVDSINDFFRFDKMHFVTFLECETASAPVYDRKNKNINICFEQFGFIEDTFYGELKSENEIASEILDVVHVVLLREFGHALLDIYDVAYSGKIEDAVDQLAVVLIAEAQDLEWDEIQKKVTVYAKALFRMHEFVEAGQGPPGSALQDFLEGNDTERGQNLLIFNDVYDNSALLGKQRFYSVLYMLTGFRADFFSPYLVINDYDRMFNKRHPDFYSHVFSTYMRTSNYWYNAMLPYFNYYSDYREEKDDEF